MYPSLADDALNSEKKYQSDKLGSNKNSDNNLSYDLNKKKNNSQYCEESSSDEGSEENKQGEVLN